MEDIAADDDLLSDMLLDSLEFEPKIATHKMNQAYRSPRYKTQDVIDIVRNRVVIECDIGKALEDLMRLDVIKKHLAGKSLRQSQEFQLHARRYLETYLPDSGIEYALTTRYKQAALQGNPEAQTSKAGQAEAQAKAEEKARQEAQVQLQTGINKGKSRMLGENGIVLGTTKADLCVVATKPFKAGDLILLCKGGVKDLTKSEDEALREEAAVDRERRKEQDYMGVLGPGRDFSVIRSARKGCSQLLLGPARFVNHDCDPNCEFHRLGHSQMVFKCLRNIGLNEEITTFYGENYFEWENSECMCKTCEERERGFFASISSRKEEEEDSTSNSSLQTGKEIDRRSSLRRIPVKSPPPKQESPGPTIATIERNGKIMTKSFNHHVSQREFDANSTTHRGPKCTCLTCGTTFWAPEAWWMPDECRRCERHYRIFKADWPGRLPTEGGFSARAKIKRREFEDKKRKSLHAPSPGISSNSDTDTPVKLSPLRDAEEQPPPLATPPPPQKRPRKKQRIIADEGTDEDVTMKGSLIERDEKDAKREKGNSKTSNSRGEDDSDLTSVSESDVYIESGMIRSSSSSSSGDSSTSSRPSGPKMLGKEAKTETLAMYWGAPSGDRRNRRQSHNGLETLAKTTKRDIIKKSGVRKEHRRNISDVTNSSTSTKVPPKSISLERDLSNEESRKGSPLEATTAIVSPQDSSGSTRATEEGFQSPMSFSLAEESLLREENGGSDSPRPVIIGLATKGPERTSVKNLAMAWSAGVEEGGRGSRKRQVRDLSQSLSAASTPPMQPKRKVSSKIEKDSTASDNGKDEEIKRESAVEVNNVELPPPAASVINTAPTSTMSAATDSTKIELPSPPIIRNVNIAEEEATAKRQISPLAGPPPMPLPTSSSSPIIFANRPGVIPGQPIRKNLRWGSGKTSTSRPLIGPGPPGSSPLGHRVVSESNVPKVDTLESPRSISYQHTQNSSNRNLSPPSASPTPLHQSADAIFSRQSLMERKTSDQLQSIIAHEETLNGKADLINDDYQSSKVDQLPSLHNSEQSNLLPSLQNNTPLSKTDVVWQKPTRMHIDGSNGHGEGL